MAAPEVLPRATAARAVSFSPHLSHDMASSFKADDGFFSRLLLDLQVIAQISDSLSTLGWDVGAIFNLVLGECGLDNPRRG